MESKQETYERSIPILLAHLPNNGNILDLSNKELPKNSCFITLLVLNINASLVIKIKR